VPRLAVVLAAAALVVALLGATPLGNAAQNTVTKVVRVGKSSKAARGPRGPRGYRGPRGFQGPPGIKGETGPAGGLPDGFEARSTTPVEITGTGPDTATTVLASGTLAVGKYAFNAQITLHGGVDTIVFCQAHGPGSAGPLLGVPAALHLGIGVGSVGQATIPLAFAATFAAPGSVYVGCWVDNPNEPRPTATSSDLVALTVGSLGGP
jgi:hypothetical protein